MREDRAMLDSMVVDGQLALPGEQLKPGLDGVNDEANSMEF